MSGKLKITNHFQETYTIRDEIISFIKYFRTFYCYPVKTTGITSHELFIKFIKLEKYINFLREKNLPLSNGFTLLSIKWINR